MRGRRIVGGVPVPQCNDRVAVRKRNRRPERLSRDLEPDGADRDRERYRNRCDRGESRMLDEHASAEPEVEHREPQTIEGAQSACVTAAICEGRSAAELETCPTRGFRRRQPRSHEVLGAQIHVKAELRLHVVVQRVASANAAQKRTDSGEKRQCDHLLLVSLGEGRLTASDGQGQVASPTRLDALSKPWLNLRQTWASGAHYTRRKHEMFSEQSGSFELRRSEQPER